MISPGQLMDLLAEDAKRLDELEKSLDTAGELLEQSEQKWLEDYDLIAWDLKNGSDKQVPEHAIVTETRRLHRDSHANWRRAERMVKKLERQISAKKSAMNGRQSLLAALRDEARADVAQPQWGRTHRVA